MTVTAWTESRETGLAACRRHGRFPGMGGIRSDELLRRHIGKGARMILAGIDVGMLIQAGRERTGFMRGCL